MRLCTICRHGAASGARDTPKKDIAWSLLLADEQAELVKGTRMTTDVILPSSTWCSLLDLKDVKGTRLSEGATINKSLFTLGLVI
jgi:hypothetical protein